MGHVKDLKLRITWAKKLKVELIYLRVNNQVKVIEKGVKNIIKIVSEEKSFKCRYQVKVKFNGWNGWKFIVDEELWWMKNY